ncbi:MULTISPECIES: bifunctional UDP-sugar hydrolase/5'-nucleotidase [Chelatococcus]|uniref:Bifunctional metallophosphatase/5'-nucleotidase n=1 Tax=Chelatococcus daeguensis TaxID=444444 RepID=A0AAC9JSA6_9HYPH|nr:MULTISPECIES: bifunctional UDP-sugar hydrolase/5'-nucleotidase [Chelatococcus]APF38326.1 bifunctional metallophosphatase/5'-nucleotidase [Chelatococcus daeguensis]
MSPISRRQTLRLGVTAGLAAATLTTGAEAAPPPASFTLLLVNDIYKMNEDKGRGGFPRLAAIVKAERARGVPMLFCHAGDCFSPSLMSGFDHGAHIVALTNMIKPDVFVPGNHEFDFGKEDYFARQREAEFPFFAANMRDAAGNPLPGHQDSAVFELGGIKVGVVGLILENVPQMSDPGDLAFLPVMDTLSRQAKKLRDDGADLVVAVTHTDRATDYEIVRSRLVDVLLTGHDHDLAIGFDGKTVMVESNEEGNYVTAIDFTASVSGDGSARKVTWTPTFRVNDSRAVDPDPEVLAVVTRYEAELSKELDIAVATLAAPLDSRTASVRSQETAIGDLIADAMREATGAAIAITNGGGIRGNKQYPAGHKLTRRDILTEMPFGNRTVVTSLTGRQVKEALENGFSQMEQRAGRFPQVSGLTVTVDPRRPAGSRVVAVTIGDAPIEDDKIYTVATNDFLLKGGDGYSMLASGVKGGDLDVAGKLMANDVMVYARKLGTIDIKPEGRILMQ